MVTAPSLVLLAPFLAPEMSHAVGQQRLVADTRLCLAAETLAQAEVRDTILSGDVADLLEFLQGRKGAGG